MQGTRQDILLPPLNDTYIWVYMVTQINHNPPPPPSNTHTHTHTH